MKAKELRGSTVDELKQKVLGLKKELFDLNYQRQMGNVDKPSNFGLTRRDTARMKTIIREKELKK